MDTKQIESARVAISRHMKGRTAQKMDAATISPDKSFNQKKPPSKPEWAKEKARWNPGVAFRCGHRPARCFFEVDASSRRKRGECLQLSGHQAAHPDRSSFPATGHA